jgi:hypothetical protein
MSRANAIKIIANYEHSTGYHFKSSEDKSSYVITSKHGICKETATCVPFNNNDDNCCRTCPVKITTDEIKLISQNEKQLTPQKIYSFPNNDLAIVSVSELSFTPLKIGNTQKNPNNKYVCYGYKGEKLEAGRILLGDAELDAEHGITYFNIDSFTIPELTEKSESYDGVSGSLVIGADSQDIVVAYSTIVKNEENNDLSGESLAEVNYEELHKFFNSIIFTNNKACISIDTSLSEQFEQLEEYNINESIKVNLLVPINKGFPYFNLNPIVEKLADEFGLVLGTSSKNKTLNSFSALKVLRENRDLKPVYQLFSSRVVEALLNAPHIYSSYINDSNYHHMHYINGSDEVDFIISGFGGGDDLHNDINLALEKMAKNINNYTISSKLISERSFLNMKFSHQECELLYQVLFSEEDEVVRNLSIVYCMDVQSCISDNILIKERIKRISKEACSKIKQETLQLINKGLSVNLFVIPLNEKNELTELMENLLNDC